MSGPKGPVRVAFVDREPPSGFMATDRRCLERGAAVERLVYPGSITPAFVRASIRAARRCDVLYVFFASEHGLVPALVFKALRRRFVLVPAGYDYADVPERWYGLRARGRGWLPVLLGRLCDVALPISDQTRWEFLAQVPTAAPHTRLAYLALDPEEWSDPGVLRDPELVVTVGYVDAEAWSRKGVDRFVEAARRDPSRCYVLVGRLTPEVAGWIEVDRPPNLELAGPLDHEALRELLWSAGTYAQLSWHETFGVAMAEAMLCGCVPVLGDSAALAEVAGRWAVMASDHPSDAAALAAGADRSRTVDQSAIRADLAERFSIEQRSEILAAAVHGDVR